MIKLEKRGYLGIDESNHGKFPEIYVGVFSLDEKDLEKGNYHKKRRGLIMRDILGELRIFKHLIIPEGYKHIFGEDGIKVISIVEIIKTFEEADLILFDGELREKDRLNLEVILFPKKSKLLVETQADEIYPIVHCADLIANLLHKYYNKDKMGKKYLDRLINFDIKNYLKFASLFE